MSRGVRLLLMLVIALPLFNGCTVVRITEQQRLRRPDMRFDADPFTRSIIGHIEAAREGSIGGSDGEGAGGCGCN